MQLTGLISGVNHTTGNNPADKHLVDRVLRGDTRAFGIIIKNTENLVAQIVFKFSAVPGRMVGGTGACTADQA